MIKMRLVMVAAALAVGTSVAGAQERYSQERYGPPAFGAQVLPAYEIITILRSTGFDPVGRPVRVGSRYEVQAIDPEDYAVRLLVDGRTGRILTVRDSDEAGPLEPPFPQDGFRRTAGRFGPLSYGPLRPGGLVPPRNIPTPRSQAAVEPQRAPVPRPRPEARREPTVASTAPNAPAVTGTTPRATTAPAASTSNSPAASTAKAPGDGAGPGPGADIGVKDSVGPLNGKNEKSARTATIPAGGPPAPDAAAVARTNSKVVPVAPLE